MKGILLFCGHKTAKRGGMADFVASFDSVFDAQQFIERADTQNSLLDTLPSLQWAHIYSIAEQRIVRTGSIEIWSRDDIGNFDDDPSTKFTWLPCNDDSDMQPLMLQATNENTARAKAEADAAALIAAEAAKTDDIKDTIANTIIRVVTFDLGSIDPVVDEVEAHIEFAFNLEAMKQECEIKQRHVKVLTFSFTDEDTAFLESIGGPGAPSHWYKKVVAHFDDDMIMSFFENEVLTEDEVASVTEQA